MYLAQVCLSVWKELHKVFVMWAEGKISGQPRLKSARRLKELNRSHIGCLEGVNPNMQSVLLRQLVDGQINLTGFKTQCALHDSRKKR